ncbi:lactonase family protein [Sphingomonas sp.]|uniref:lactonase family protein n=1 Tax=Sphingomonas sp. TaxID=28214 RepID=UPI003D6C9FC3
MSTREAAKRIGTGLAGEGIDKRIASAPRAATGIARRTMLGSAMLAVTALGTSRLIAGGLAMDNTTTGQLVYIGCRTTRERNARGNGITVARIRPDGLWQIVQSLDGIVNPAFLAFDQQRRFLFTVHGDGNEVSAFAIDAKTGTLGFIGKQACQGKNPVHLAVDPTSKFLLVANHLTVDGFVSNVAVLPIGDDGRLGPVTDLAPLTGPIGPHRTEQPFAKPHQICFDPKGALIAVPDKGLDRVFTLRLDASGKLQPAGTPMLSREGAGPRHLAFHPVLPFAYIVDELNPTIVAARVDAAAGTLTAMQIVSAVRDDFTGTSRGSEIAVSPDGRHVFASNRGSDTIASFPVDPATGRLGAGSWQTSGGRTPRFFAVAPGGGALFTANEDSDSICRLAIDPATGRLAPPVPVMTTGSPTCMIFAPAPR